MHFLDHRYTQEEPRLWGSRQLWALPQDVCGCCIWDQHGRGEFLSDSNLGDTCHLPASQLAWGGARRVWGDEAHLFLPPFQPRHDFKSASG